MGRYPAPPRVGIGCVGCFSGRKYQSGGSDADALTAIYLYYGAHIAGLVTPNNDLVKQLQQVAMGIQGDLSLLITSEVNTVDIDDAISGAIIDWRVIEERCSKNNCISFEEKSIDPSEVFLVTNQMLIKIDKITGMHAKLLD